MALNEKREEAVKKITDKMRMTYLEQQAKTTNAPVGWRAVCFEVPVIHQLLSFIEAVDCAIRASRGRTP